MHIYIEELQASAVGFDSVPGIGLYQAIEIVLELIDSEFIRAAIEIVAKATDGAGVNIDGGIRQTLSFKIRVNAALPE